jgi:hypothetical protein
MRDSGYDGNPKRSEKWPHQSVPASRETRVFVACQECMDSGAYLELNVTQIRERAERRERAEISARETIEDIPQLAALFGRDITDHR